MAAIGDLLFAGVREVVYRRSLPLATRNLQVLQTALSERAGVLGLAASTVRSSRKFHGGHSMSAYSGR